MAKRKKKRETLGKIIKDIKVEERPPECYGQRADFCRRELCGKWFDSCKSGSGAS